MNDSNPYITIAFSVAVYAAFAWFLGNRFLRSLISQCAAILFYTVILFPIICFPATALVYVVLYFIVESGYKFEIAVGGGILITSLSILYKYNDVKLTSIIIDLPFILWAFFQRLFEYFSDVARKIRQHSNPAMYLLQEKSLKHVIEEGFKSFYNEIDSFYLYFGFFLFFIILPFTQIAELWPFRNISNFKWYLIYDASNLQVFVFSVFSISLLVWLYGVSHRQRLKAIFNDFIFVLKLAKNNGQYLFMKGRGEIVDGDLTEVQLIDIESLPAKSPIFFTIDDDLCLLLDSRAEFKDFLTLMRSVREFGVDVLADKLGISVENFDED